MYRRLLKYLLYRNWRSTLTRGERIRLDHWGATGNKKHHSFSWAECGSEHDVTCGARSGGWVAGRCNCRRTPNPN